jgi:hypothetical protein
MAVEDPSTNYKPTLAYEILFVSHNVEDTNFRLFDKFNVDRVYSKVTSLTPNIIFFRLK